jgi:hypothetical protein
MIIDFLTHVILPSWEGSMSVHFNYDATLSGSAARIAEIKR